MFRPLNKNVLLTNVQITNASQKIFLGNNASKKYQVVSIGKEVVEVKVNDIVYLNESKLIKLNIDNKEYFVIDEQDIYIITEE